MRVRELTLTNFRGFESHRVEFSSNFTIVAGINGRGKTTILEALALLISRLLPKITKAVGGYRAFSKWDVRRSAQENAVESELVMSVNCAGIPLRFRGWIFGEKLQRFTRLPKPLCTEIQNAYGGDRSRANDAAPIAVYYTTDRATYTQPRNLKGKIARGQAAAYHRALLKKKVDFKDFIRRYRVMSLLKDGSPGDNPYFIGSRAAETIKSVLHEFLGDVGDIKAVDDGWPRLVVQKGNTPLDPEQLSDGERSFLAMVTDLCRRLWLANPELENPLRGAGVVLIDELELHLHPKWQREVVEKLRNTFPNLQFITTTHSPFIIQTAREGEVIKLDGELAVEPTGRTIEEVARLVMGVTDLERSPRFTRMIETAHRYLELSEQAKLASPIQREQIRQELVKLLAPFTDNPAYTAVLERRGVVEPENPEEGESNAPS